MIKPTQKQIDLWIKEGVSFTAGYMAVVHNSSTNLTYPKYFFTKEDYKKEKFSAAEKVISVHDLTVKPA